ncbi:U-box domain-containing protein 62 isoform X2 [Rosa chinensis]|uniref:U-box domain-containing protein 62 isoform X2 n=1 Tax=Rosa chinensis TaxID=74649 RepID=UPI000D08A47D|nr:U-box domain-containing protein 62 isoform X2 [Rosa chinensis]
MILPCGHSFGAGGVQQVITMKACFTCSQSISEDSIAPNLSLRSAVQAFRHEEELHFYLSSKRKRERPDQDRGGYGDLALTHPPRGRGVQFPFLMTNRVIIKGNKRTPQRFVGREAVVTTQCLNGWHVVKTLDNAESVKLQYHSLAKVSDDSSSKALPSNIHDIIHDIMSSMTNKQCLIVNVGEFGPSFLPRVNEKGSMGLRFSLKESIFKQRLFQVKKNGSM